MSTAIDTPLTEDERADLAGCEMVIDRGRKTFVEVGAALMEVRDRRLYRETHGAFEEYVQARWDFTWRRAYQLIEAAAVVENLKHASGLPEVTSARQAEALARVEPEKQAEVWQEAVARAGGEAPPARVVAEVIADRDAERYAAFNAAFGKKEAPAPTPEPKAVRDGDEWYTPRQYADAAREVMGGIDLDPASCALANEMIGADCWYGLPVDGLKCEWFGRVWLNPPYSNTGEWAWKVVDDFRREFIEQAIILVNAKTETAWFNDLMDTAGVACLVRSRIAFVPGDGGESQTGRTGSAIFYLGPNVGEFCQVFGQFGRLVCDWREVA